MLVYVRLVSAAGGQAGVGCAQNGHAGDVPSARTRTVLLTTLVVMALDWASKAAVKALAPGSVVPHYTRPNPLVLPLVMMCGWLLVRLIDRPQAALALGVALGGMAGNLFERMLGSPVTDFIALPPLPWAPAAVWNLADFAIWLSVPLLALAAAQHFQAGRRQPASTSAA
jgi:lipoprotein signal peptidase